MNYTTEKVQNYLASLTLYKEIKLVEEIKGDCMYFEAINAEGIEVEIRVNVEKDAVIHDWSISDCSKERGWRVVHVTKPLPVGTVGFLNKKGYIEECAIQAIHTASYTVKSSYFTFDVMMKDLFATREEAEADLAKKRQENLLRYLEAMDTKEDFIEFCIQKAHEEARDPEYGDRDLVKALELRYQEFFGKELK